MPEIQKAKTPLSGAYGVAVTPFREDGGVDFDTFQTLLDRACGSGITGVVVCGSTSEFIFLTPDQNTEVIKKAAEALGGRKQLICGATSPDRLTAEHYLEHIAKIGGDAALIAPPYYLRYGEGDILAYYAEISCHNSGVPVMAYHVPQFTNGVSLRIFEEMLSMEGLAGIKDSDGDINNIIRQICLRDALNPSFKVMTGSDDSIYPSLAAGCDGNLTATAYTFPGLISLFYENYTKGNPAKALEIQKDLYPALRLAAGLLFPIGFKLLLEAATGIPAGAYRQVISARLRAEMDKAFAEMKSEVDLLKEKYGAL